MTRKRSSTGRNAAVMAGGIAIGIVGSRLLPPLVAAMSGSRRARAGEDPFALLIEDHRQLLSILDQMAAAHTGSTVQRSRMFLKLKRKLAKHALAEEDVVYPELHSETQHSGQSKHLYDEHADMKILLFQLENLLKSGQDWSTPVGTLRELVRRHAAEEEQTVFPRLREKLAENRRTKVSGQISREEAMIL